MKNRTNLLRCTGVLVASLAALVTNSFAFTFILNDGTGLPIKWPAPPSGGATNTPAPVAYRLLLGTTPTLSDGTNYNTSVQAAINLWNTKIGSIQLQGSQGTGSPNYNNNLNELAFADDVYGTAFGANTLALTTGSSAGNERVKSDTLFNKGRTWDSYRGPTQGGKVDIQRVALHELGHALGLDHPDQASPAQPVAAIMISLISNLDTLTDDDIQGAQSLYGPSNVPPNDNFANAEPIDLNSGTTTKPGYNTRATKQAGEPNHAGNAGGRSVWFRWTPNVSASAIMDTKGSYYDTLLAVYSGTALNALTPVASSDDINDGIVQASSVSFNVSAGVTYYIAVDGYNGADRTPPDTSGADNGGFKLNLNLTGVALAPPTITNQPASLTVNAGQSATFSVAAIGTAPLTYQWLFNNLVISGATDTSFGLNGAQAANAGKYSVKITNEVGTVTSSNATLTVQAVVTPTPPSTGGGGGGGGGGGAPSPWFIGVLLALGLGRLLSRRTS